jgi:hypothetical protein
VPPFRQQRQQEVPAPRAQIKNLSCPVGIDDRKAELNQALAVRPRIKHGVRNLELTAIELLDAGDLRNGLAQCAALHQRLVCHCCRSTDAHFRAGNEVGCPKACRML